MSSFPFLLGLAEELDNVVNQRSCVDNYGLGYYPQRHYHQRPLLRLRLSDDYLPQRRGKNDKDTVSSVGKEGFQVSMDVQQFKPSELTVKTVDNCIVVEGKHEEREDEHGYISRHFSRRYCLPKGYDPNEVVSTLSSDGVLTVKVPPPVKSLESNERIIQIQQTGPAHLSVKDNPKDEEEKKDATPKK